MVDVEDLKRLAYEFRMALDIVVEERLYGRLNIFENFPNECCRYTNDLLAEYLIYKGIPMECIQMLESETMENGYTHCWLYIDSTFFVDICADQFNEHLYFEKYFPIPKCCVVLGGKNYLYECFDREKTSCLRNIGIYSYNGDVTAKWRKLYEEITNKIDKTCMEGK